MFEEQLLRLDGLLALSRTTGLDVRGTLVRVLTDLFVQAPHRSAEDVAHYVELTAHLVEQVDEEARIAVAAKLGPCPFAPRALLDRLLASEPEAAARVIAASPLLTAEDLWALAGDGGPVTDAAIASRDDLAPDLIRFLVAKGHPLVAETLVANQTLQLDREMVLALAPLADTLQGLADRLADRREIAPEWLAPLFLHLSPAARERVLSACARVQNADRFSVREPQAAAPKLLLDALEHAALSRSSAELCSGLASLLAIAPEDASRLLADPSGEALALALLAVAMPAEQAMRVLMFANDAVGRSVERVRALALMMETMPRPAATRLVRAFAPPHTLAASHHRPVFAEGVTPARPRLPPPAAQTGEARREA